MTKEIVKKFNKDFMSRGGALTLSPNFVTDNNDQSGFKTKLNESGWTISGQIQEDYYTWINDFTANHPKYGYVKGNFEIEVTASSEEAFQHFWKHHEPDAWDYWDI